MNGFQALKPICEIIIQLSSKVLTQKRKNTNLIEVLADVGGFMKVVLSMFKIITPLITDILYDKALVNNLFSFDLDKKMVEIKKKDNNSNSNTKKLEVHPIIYVNNNIQDELSEQSRNKMNEDISKNCIVSPNSKSIYIKEENLKSSDLIKIYNINKNVNVGKIENMMQSEVKMGDKEADRGNENRRIIDRIKMKCCCVYFWFCLARKKKNILNLSLDEGMRIIEEKLDIINIFKKIYSTEFIEKNLKIKGNMLEMSDVCRQKIKLYT